MGLSNKRMDDLLAEARISIKNAKNIRRNMRQANCYLFSFRNRYPGFRVADQVSELLIRFRNRCAGFGMDNQVSERVIKLRNGCFSFRNA